MSIASSEIAATSARMTCRGCSSLLFSDDVANRGIGLTTRSYRFLPSLDHW
jgi:hypothetical protein